MVSLFGRGFDSLQLHNMLGNKSENQVKIPEPPCGSGFLCVLNRFSESVGLVLMSRSLCCVRLFMMAGGYIFTYSV